MKCLSSYDYLLNSPINFFHVFSYSERTLAHSRKFENQIDATVIKSRSKRLRELSNRKLRSYLNTYLNKPLKILFESKKNGYWVGHAENFALVAVKSDMDLK